MAFSCFTNLTVEFWIARRKLGRTPRCLCLRHQHPDEGRPILDALEELAHEPLPGRRTLTFVRCDRSRPLTKLQWIVTPPSDALQIMHLHYADETAFLETTPAGVPFLVDAFNAWFGGSEDFCVSPDHAQLNPKAFGALDRASTELWFWGPTYDL